MEVEKETGQLILFELNRQNVNAIRRGAPVLVKQRIAADLRGTGESCTQQDGD